VLQKILKVPECVVDYIYSFCHVIFYHGSDVSPPRLQVAVERV